MSWEKGYDPMVRELLQEILKELKKTNTYTININIEKLVGDNENAKVLANKIMNEIKTKGANL